MINLYLKVFKNTGTDITLIVNDTNSSSGLNIAALGMMTAEDIVIEPITALDSPKVCELVKAGIGAYEEAGTVVASTFRRLSDLVTIYSLSGSTYIVAKDKRQVLSPAEIALNLQNLDACTSQTPADSTALYAIIGGAGIGPLHGLSPLEGLGEIRDLVVKPEWRGNGIGARLLKRCLEEAKRIGYQRLYLEATPQMEQAQKLFMRYGFRPVTTGAPKVGQGDSMPCYYILETLT